MMTKKVFKYFFDAIDGQEKWLNKMATDGFRLVSTTKLMYEFESCNPTEYNYKIEFVADKSYKQIQQYRDFLKAMGFHTFIKNININYSVVKLRLRPWAKVTGRIATIPGNINKELLIIEKKNDGKPFEMHTDLSDLIGYYTTIRNAYLYAAIMLISLIIFGRATHSFLEPLSVVIKGLSFTLSLILAFIVIKYSSLIYTLKEKRKTNE